MFTRAITRKPCKALIDGISTGQFCDGTPDYEAAVKQHDIYVATLRELGLDVTELDADERFPDSCFVEDPAVVMEQMCIRDSCGACQASVYQRPAQRGADPGSKSS